VIDSTDKSARTITAKRSGNVNNGKTSVADVYWR
jgi:hypothetical protein